MHLAEDIWKRRPTESICLL